MELEGHGLISEVGYEIPPSLLYEYTQDNELTIRRRAYHEYISRFSSRYSRTRELRNAVYDRDGYECLSCGESEISQLSLDHIIPRSKGGMAILSNLQTLCKNCNEEKGNRIIDFRKRKGQWNLDLK